MEQRSTIRLMVVFGLGVIAAALFGAYRLWEISQRPAETEWTRFTDQLFAQYQSGLENARERWQEADMAHYRLSIRRGAPDQNPEEGKSCQQVIEVRDEQVIGVEVDDCPSADYLFSPAGDTYPLTVMALFAQIERDMAGIVWSAQGVGCSFLVVDVGYHTGAGYPTTIVYRWSLPPSGLGFPIEAQYFPPGEAVPSGGCNKILPVDGPEITIAVEALP